MKRLTKSVLFGMICGAALGCTENDSPVSNTGTMDRPVTVTANRPVTSDNDDKSTRDQNSDTKTPIDQNENAADIKITADIRSKVVDTEMSVDAQNVEIITQDGKVTLKGNVATEEEKQQVEEIARGVAGSGNVDSQLTVE